MGAIITASQDYARLAWVWYDAAYRRQATITGNTQWSMINSTLYTIHATMRALLCNDSAKDCSQQGDPDPGMLDRLKAIETAVLALTSKPPTMSVAMSRTALVRPSNELCRKWNSKNCTYLRCRYNLVCSGWKLCMWCMHLVHSYKQVWRNECQYQYGQNSDAKTGKQVAVELKTLKTL